MPGGGSFGRGLGAVPRLLPTIALCSLACSVALAGLWTRSYWRGDIAGWTDDNGTGLTVASVRGKAVIVWGLRGTPGGGGWSWSTYDDPDPGDLVGLGDGVVVADWDDRDGVLWLPLWLVAGPALVPPGAWAWRRKRRGARGFPVEASAA